MGLNLKKILEQVDETIEEFSANVKIPVNTLHLYAEDKDKIPFEILETISRYTNLKIADFQTSDALYTSNNGIIPADTWAPSQIAKSSLTEYILQGLTEIPDECTQTEIYKIQTYIKNLKKPRISFAGQSDTGKSTLINTLLGAEKMPAKWTPTTSIIVYIKHINDRPAFIKDTVWIFKKSKHEYWDDSRLEDEKYCRRFLVAKGDYSLLETYGTHQGETSNTSPAASAVAFIDSPLLINCDILDLPGFAASKEDDALHEISTQKETDILIYLSRSNGFLQDRDIDYLKNCLFSLRPAEQNGQNDIEKLENLFIIASQAGAVNNGNASELKEILTRRCSALCKTLSNSKNKTGTLLPYRTEQTGYDYKDDDFRKRFFTYEKDSERLCKGFKDAFTHIAEKLPKALHKDFCKNLKIQISDSSNILIKRINEYELMMNEREQYINLLQIIRENEAGRKSKQNDENHKMYQYIENTKIETMDEISTKYHDLMTTDSLISLINNHNYKNKKNEKEEFASLVNTILSDSVQEILKRHSDAYTQEVDKFLSKYSNSFADYKVASGISVQFDTTNSFALGLAGLGALGASAAWLATSFTAWSVAVLGSLAGWGPILAVCGVAGIAISAIVATALAFIKAFTWKKDLAKSIINTYESEKYIEKIGQEVKNYWNDTKNSFEAATVQVEEDWQNKIKEYQSLADEKNLPMLRKKLSLTRQGLNFFTQMPTPDN